MVNEAGKALWFQKQLDAKADELYSTGNGLG